MNIDANERMLQREARLRALGYEEPTPDQRERNMQVNLFGR